jgi:orotidine 5'-phosphate decarboxylase subfamily 2
VSLATRVAECVDLTDSVLCLGLDPAKAKNAKQAQQECLKLLDQTSPFICAVKPNVAFFERFGSEGIAALEEVIRHVPEDRLLILDAKRGDIGSTSAAYAASAFNHFGADAVTVNPLMGHDSVAPFLDYADKGAFILTRTSNKGADDFLRLRLQGGSRLFERIVENAVTWDVTGAVGFVVGATDVSAIETVRHHAPDAPLLIPGVGAQGGDLDAALLAGMGKDGGGVIFPMSRSLASASSPKAEAKKMRDLCNAVRRVHRTARVS